MPQSSSQRLQVHGAAYAELPVFVSFCKPESTEMQQKRRLWSFISPLSTNNFGGLLPES
jgi:hypothetical protein